MNKPQKKSGFYIDVTCPGCGGELELQRDFFSLECKYCGSVLRVVMPEAPPAYFVDCKQRKNEIRFKIDRHLKEQKLPLSRGELAIRKQYFPFWKVEAIQLQVTQQTVEHEPGHTNNPFTTNIDHGGNFQWGRALGSALTGPATSMPESKINVNLKPYMTTIAASPYMTGVPNSIGMRAEYIKIKPLTPEDGQEDADFIPVSANWNDVKAGLQKSIEMRGRAYNSGKYNRSELFRPEGSIVYFPFLIAEVGTSGGAYRFVFDGITGRILHMNEIEEVSDFPEETSIPSPDFGQINVKLHRCRNCGIDLPADKSSVYVCRNCSQAISIDQDYTLSNGVLIVKGGSMRSQADKLFPFWSFKLSPQIISRLVTPVSLDGPGDRLIVPGFHMGNFDAMRRLSRRITSVVQGYELSPILEYSPAFLPVTMGLNEAEIMAEAILYCSQLEKNPGVKASEFASQTEDVRLFYAPFHPENYFYVDSLDGAVTFEKNTVDIAE
ncbi:MAG: hypothetical protein R3F48_16270 [Candidatus Zixiibacteriota bacterium]